MLDYEQLPKELKEVLASVELRYSLNEITEKNKLHIDEAEILEDSVNHVLMGALKPNDFPKALESGLEIDKDTAQKIAMDVSVKIFAPIRESLKKIHEEREEIMDEDSERDEMMRAISEQPEIPKVEKNIVTPPEQPTPTPFPDAPAPNIQPVQEDVSETEATEPASIHEEKLSSTTSQAPSETVINKRVTESLVPEEMKKKINEDPYKESIE